jgi:hypothetical protein
MNGPTVFKHNYLKERATKKEKIWFLPKGLVFILSEGYGTKENMAKDKSAEELFKNELKRVFESETETCIETSF